MKAESCGSSRLFGGPAGLALVSVATIAGLAAARAAEPAANPCGNAVSILNEGKAYEAFDRQNGGSEKRLRFRLDGEAPCEVAACTAGAGTDGKQEPKATANEATKDAARESTKGGIGKATKVEIVASSAGAERVIAAIDLTGRSASYCVYGLSRVETTPAQRRIGCPPRYLVNFVAIKLTDGEGPFARRDVSVQYVYSAEAGTAPLDRCAPPAVVDGMFRRGAWTVMLADGAAAHICEIDFPRNGRAPVPRDPPFATTVFGAHGP
jgi:hypothetical protein